MTGIPARIMGNGEGFTTIILTTAESMTIREAIAQSLRHEPQASAAFNRGIQRATDRIKAEFDAEQKARKAGR